MQSSIIKVIKSLALIQTIVVNLTHGQNEDTKSLEELVDEYEDDKNSMIAVTEMDSYKQYDEFYDQTDNRLHIESSMNMIFFGPVSSFMRLDTETILHILLYTKKNLIPIERVLLSWDIVTDGKTAAFLQRREYLAFGSLLNVIPEEDLYYVNFGDPSVLKYFATFKLKLRKRKIGVLTAAYRRYFGDDWYMNSTYINELGYLFCGFPWYMLKRIKPVIFKDISSDILGKLKNCDVHQSKTLYEIATHNDAYGDPYKWSSHEITKMNHLFIYIPKEDICGIHLEAVAAIQPSVMKLIPQDKLEFFTKQQIMRLNPKTRRIYIFRTQLKASLDETQITKHSDTINNHIYLIIFTVASLFQFYCHPNSNYLNI